MALQLFFLHICPKCHMAWADQCQCNTANGQCAICDQPVEVLNWGTLAENAAEHLGLIPWKDASVAFCHVTVSASTERVQEMHQAHLRCPRGDQAGS